MTQSCLPSLRSFLAIAVAAALGGVSGEAFAGKPAPLPSWPPPPDPDDAAPAASAPLPPLPPPADDEGSAAEETPGEAPRRSPTPEAHCEDQSAKVSDSDTPPAPADDAPKPDPWEVAPLMLESQFGLGTPLGLAGIALDYAPAPALSLNVGVGLGFAGVQYAASARVRPVRFGHRAHFAPFLGGGFSAGPHSQSTDIFVDHGDSANLQWKTAYWMNLEAGMELRFTTHFELRPVTGVAILLNQNSGVADQWNSAPVPVDTWMFYAGLTVAYGFGF